MSIISLHSIAFLALTFLLFLNKSLLCAMEADSLPSSRSWNSLVGKAGDIAASEIRKQFPDYKVHIVKHVSDSISSRERRIKVVDLLFISELDGYNGSSDG